MSDLPPTPPTTGLPSPTTGLPSPTTATTKKTSTSSSSSGFYSCGCSFQDCTCGEECLCTEPLCQCEASSVVNSLSATNGRSPTMMTTKKRRNLPSKTTNNAARTCCSSSSTTAATSTTTKTNTQSRKVSFEDGNDIEAAMDAETRKLPAVGDTNVKNNNNNNDTNINTLEIGILGMTCSMCSRAVTQAIQPIEGIQSVNVSLPTDSARIIYDPNKISPTQIASTIEDIGYEVVGITFPNGGGRQYHRPTMFANLSDPSSDRMDSEANSRKIIKTVDFVVRGMTCSMCTRSVQQALEAIPGVEHVVVSLATNIARVQFDVHHENTNGNTTNVEILKETIEDIGYEVVDSTEIREDTEEISSHRLDRMLEQQEKQVRTRKQAFLWSLVGTCPIVFFTMILPHLPLSQFQNILQTKVDIAGTPIVLEALILWILCTPIQFGSGWEFFKTTYFNLRTGVLGMDVLVTLGTSSSYGYAVWATLSGTMEYHFFETSAVLICFVLLGKWMQRLAVRRTSLALTQLLALQPKTAIKVIPLARAASTNSSSWNPLVDSYEEIVVPLEFIHQGDVVKILKGSSIPADGIVSFGEMSVDESMITGESVPVLKTKGSVVLGGTVCAEAGQAAGSAFVEVTGVGSATALSQIVKLVSEAQSRQVPIQNLADTVASYFVPSVVTISVLTYMVWYGGIQSGMISSSYLPSDESPATFSLLFGIACLVISCPCALGLATPTAIMVGTAVGAKNGILFKGGETLELASKVDAIIFDKTGTLTRGKPVVSDFIMMVTDATFWNSVLPQGENDDRKRDAKQHLLWLLGSLERNSEHPLATAIVSYADNYLKKDEILYVQPTNFSASTGRGASGMIGEKNTHVAVGNRDFCRLNSVPIDYMTEEKLRSIERQGSTAIIAAINGVIIAVMGIADEAKPDAAEAIRYLREEMKMDVWMVTGDNRRTARAVARKLNFPMDRVVAEALPVAKVQKVQELQQRGYVVAMVGDGVNDSPALAQSDVGLSLGSGAEIAAEASDMVLVKGNVFDVCTALDLSRVIFRRIKLNLLWSLLYNCLSIPIAAGVFYPLLKTRLPPTVAAIAMAMSSISVVGSSLALHFYQSPRETTTTMTTNTTTRRTNRRNRRIGEGGGGSTTTTTMTTSTTTTARPGTRRTSTPRSTTTTTGGRPRMIRPLRTARENGRRSSTADQEENDLQEPLLGENHDSETTTDDELGHEDV